MATLYALKRQVMTLLLEETFSYVHAQQRAGFVSLAKENAALLKVTANHLTFDGQTYPALPASYTTSKGVSAPHLHPLLYPKMDDLLRIVDSHTWELIRNYYSRILSLECPGDLLERMLPKPLWNALVQGVKGSGTALQQALRSGDLQRKAPTEELLARYQSELEEHYADTQEKIRDLLMERLLLQEG